MSTSVFILYYIILYYILFYYNVPDHLNRGVTALQYVTTSVFI